VKEMKKNGTKLISLIDATLSIGSFLFGCSTANKISDTSASNSSTASSAVSESTAVPSSEETVTLKVLADLTPHSELLEFIAPVLAEQGITLEIVSTAADATWNEKTSNGEVDFNYFQHLPYLESYNETNGADLISVGTIHVEPIAAYSNFYTTVADVPEDAKIIIPNDPTNEYRALKILEQAGFIKLDPAVEDTLQADISNITEYVKPVEIVEIDSIQIIGLAADFDIYITNTNKALEAGIDTTKYLFRENADSPYGNIIVTTSDRANDPAILAVVAALKSAETQAYIESQYNGAVVPASNN
jgi:D-methionine transport system substrate-binding protein